MVRYENNVSAGDLENLQRQDLTKNESAYFKAILSVFCGKIKNHEKINHSDRYLHLMLLQQS